ncbi:Dihydrolipoyllysine-residue succinyltransferase component of 2-oxoglutarate dehydrogenase complex, mitochondrial [Neolecta irregularis DAH-3]|uniref:dihydrolipoyllysine-residue succinyltransferase n=1 Tax=Neolecta irregularis (strain DAH-3) TaxID=1198029 RepID=A0A1U7LHW1_NEOID|nr:Dihydrolipoyllysine-residue succinyltransferase component of 2-oxoglutarate dehydrogenase complex, mitochondrial [Neolecta irregularis DAH-3]|eukprot:OLL22183.1 Dihydrolipoyllysine-residue succinyltransferase component of 2-oxoglutarate dehydrogenase complex, mitochondrial [Neolecta irregularis DAH-3]
MLSRRATSVFSYNFLSCPARLGRCHSCSRCLFKSTASSRSLPTIRTFLKTCSIPIRFNPSAQVRFYADKVIKVPQMAESLTEGTLKQWTKQVGDYVERDEEVATIETDKIDVSVNSPEAGTIKEHLAKEEDTVQVGQDLFRMELGGESPKESPAKEDANGQPREALEVSKGEQQKQKKDTAVASKEKQNEPERSGKKMDKNSPPPQESTPHESSTANAFTGIGRRDERRVKMNRMRLRIAERLKESQNTAASLTTFNEVDMSNLMEMRSLYKDEILKKTGVKLGFMSAFTKAVILSMRDIPAINASIEGPNGGDTIVYRDYVDMSIAVATPKGLVTPVIRNAETLDFVGIEKAIAELEARDGRLTVEDMAGGTFTISNGGVFGSLMGTPIINLPQTAVLGLHAIKDRPIAINGQVAVRPMMYLALTYDHRLVDGREAVTFLKMVKEYIEDPRKMLL